MMRKRCLKRKKKTPSLNPSPKRASTRKKRKKLLTRNKATSMSLENGLMVLIQTMSLLTARKKKRRKLTLKPSRKRKRRKRRRERQRCKLATKRKKRS